MFSLPFAAILRIPYLQTLGVVNSFTAARSIIMTLASRGALFDNSIVIGKRRKK